MTQRKKIEVSPGNAIFAIVILVVFFLALSWLVTGVFKVLAWVAPVLLVATLVMDYNIVLGYLKWIVNLTKRNPLMGVGAGLLTFFGFPVVAGYLFIKALLYRKVNKLKEEVEKREKGEFVDYEEVDEKPTIIELPKIKEPQKQRRDDNYDQFFE